MSIQNPCITCGACCAFFWVSFYWAEGDDAGGTVPADLTEQVTPFLRCMTGTNNAKPDALPCLARRVSPPDVKYIATGLPRAGIFLRLVKMA